MSIITMTVKQLQDLGIWESVLEYKGYNPYVLNEGLMDEDSLVTFESNYKELAKKSEKNIYFNGESYSKEEFKDYIECELEEIENAERNLREVLNYLINNNYNISDNLDDFRLAWITESDNILNEMENLQ